MVCNVIFFLPGKKKIAMSKVWSHISELKLGNRLFGIILINRLMAVDFFQKCRHGSFVRRLSGRGNMGQQTCAASIGISITLCLSNLNLLALIVPLYGRKRFLLPDTYFLTSLVY